MQILRDINMLCVYIFHHYSWHLKTEMLENCHVRLFKVHPNRKKVGDYVIISNKKRFFDECQNIADPIRMQ